MNWLQWRIFQNRLHDIQYCMSMSQCVPFAWHRLSLSFWYSAGWSVRTCPPRLCMMFSMTLNTEKNGTPMSSRPSISENLQSMQMLVTIHVCSTDDLYKRALQCMQSHINFDRIFFFVACSSLTLTIGKCPNPLRNRDVVTLRSWLPMGKDYIIMNYSVKHAVSSCTYMVSFVPATLVLKRTHGDAHVAKWNKWMHIGWEGSRWSCSARFKALDCLEAKSKIFYKKWCDYVFNVLWSISSGSRLFYAFIFLIFLFFTWKMPLAKLVNTRCNFVWTVKSKNLQLSTVKVSSAKNTDTQVADMSAL